MKPLGEIRYLTIHCAATPEGRRVTHNEISDWDIAKFGQVSYHWVVELDGFTYRTLPDSDRGAHVGGHNTGNIGICYVGGMSADMKKPKDTRTEAQIRAMASLVRHYRTIAPGLIVRGHRDWSTDLDGDGIIEPHEWKKACPSFDVAEWLKTLKG